MAISKKTPPQVILDDFTREFSSAGAQLAATSSGVLTPQDPMAPRPDRERLILSCDGLENSGKTHFAGSVPDQPRGKRAGILYQCFDRKSIATIEKFRNGVCGTKKIAVMDYSHSFPMGCDDVMKSNIAHVVFENFRTHFYKALEVARTVVWDHAGAVWETLRYARFGKLKEIPPLAYGPVNMEYEELIDRAYESDCNLILLHRLGDQWENVEKMNRRGEVKEVGEKTGRMERKPAYKGIGFKVQVGLRVSFDHSTKSSTGLITDCQPDKTKEGMVIPNLDFTNLAYDLCPNIDPSAWS